MYERVKKLQNEYKQAKKSSVQTAGKKNRSINTSSRIIETAENDRGKASQKGIKDERKCYACVTKGHKIKNCESKLSIFVAFKENLSTQKLKRIIEEHESVKSNKIKEVQTGQKKQEMVCLSKKREV